MIYKVQLHCHTTNSHDGKLTPLELIDAYRATGFHAIAITDHDYETEIVSPYDDFIVLKGVELGQTGKQTLLIEDTIRIMAHPGKRGFRWEKEDYPAMQGQFIELFNGRTGKRYQEESDYARRYGISRVCADDAHDRTGIGRAWIEVEAPKLTKEAILKAILERKYTKVWCE